MCKYSPVIATFSFVWDNYIKDIVHRSIRNKQFLHVLTKELQHNCELKYLFFASLIEFELVKETNTFYLFISIVIAN